MLWTITSAIMVLLFFESSCCSQSNSGYELTLFQPLFSLPQQGTLQIPVSDRLVAPGRAQPVYQIQKAGKYHSSACVSHNYKAAPQPTNQALTTWNIHAIIHT